MKDTISSGSSRVLENQEESPALIFPSVKSQLIQLFPVQCLL